MISEEDDGDRKIKSLRQALVTLASNVRQFSVKHSVVIGTLIVLAEYLLMLKLSKK